MNPRMLTKEEIEADRKFRIRERRRILIREAAADILARLLAAPLSGASPSMAGITAVAAEAAIALADQLEARGEL